MSHFHCTRICECNLRVLVLQSIMSKYPGRFKRHIYISQTMMPSCCTLLYLISLLTVTSMGYRLTAQGHEHPNKLHVHSEQWREQKRLLIS